ncbi:hypothetical protein HKBW3S42_01803, partial [Candidatus Hakubella thermalkaliphila]
VMHRVRLSFLNPSFRTASKVCDAIEPCNLVQAVLKDQPEMLAGNTGLYPELTKTLIEHLQSRGLEELHKLETVHLPDKPEISFEVEAGTVKSFNELSVGMKITIIVSLAMMEGRAPLIIDQPEDSLDTQFIYEEIVRRLREEKERRQSSRLTMLTSLWLATPSYLSFVLDASADKGVIKSEGGIDRPDTNRLLLLHLEGGPEAFELRAQKYLR